LLKGGTHLLTNNCTDVGFKLPDFFSDNFSDSCPDSWLENLRQRFNDDALEEVF
jgi:hypothetical protein